MKDFSDISREDMAASSPTGEKDAPKAKIYKTAQFQSHRPVTPIWLISFTDLMGLTLSFFVLLFTMSSPPEKHEQKEKQEIESQQKLAGPATPEGQGGPSDKVALNRIDYNQSLDLVYLKSVLENLAGKTPILKKVSIVEDQDNKRLILILPHDLLFELGKADISPAGQDAIEALTAQLKYIRNGLEIVGHADPSIATRSGVSNWNISLSRALAVASLMVEEGYSRPLPVQGLSSGLYDHMPTNLPEERRLALSRRVDIIINVHDNTPQQRFGIAGP